MSGFLLVDKPAGLTSHDVVARVRRLAGTRRVGHAGTLDPMATGLLVLGLERGTKLLTFAVGGSKTYLATIRLGVGTLTDDAEGEAIHVTGFATPPSDQAILAGIDRLTGEIDQVPSAVSAIKVAGVRSYTRVRSGEEVKLEARRVTVSRFEVLARREVDAQAAGAANTCVDLDVVVDCSSGTYIRALARDLGAGLGAAGHLTALRRTRVGPFDLAQALPLKDVGAPPALIDLALAAKALLPSREVDDDERKALGFGQWLTCSSLGEGPVAALGRDGALVAVLLDDGDRARPQVVFSGAPDS